MVGAHKKIGCAAPVMALESGAAPSAPTWHPAPRAAAADCGGTAGTPRRLIPEGGADPVTKRQRRALDHARHGAPRPAHAASPRWREVQTAKHRAGGRRSGAETPGESSPAITLTGALACGHKDTMRMSAQPALRFALVLLPWLTLGVAVARCPLRCAA